MQLVMRNRVDGKGCKADSASGSQCKNGYGEVSMLCRFPLRALARCRCVTTLTLGMRLAHEHAQNRVRMHKQLFG
jgi:hypothetical protein